MGIEEASRRTDGTVRMKQWHAVLDAAQTDFIYRIDIAGRAVSLHLPACQQQQLSQDEKRLIAVIPYQNQ